MEKNLVEPFKTQYVKLIKDTGETLQGTITDIVGESIIFQTEVGRSAIAMNSIMNITTCEVGRRTKKKMQEFKI
ncbi:MAG: hypothetical protein V1726_05240 [Methanobacteriota archaeon]